MRDLNTQPKNYEFFALTIELLTRKYFYFRKWWLRRELNPISTQI